jgi:glutamyl-tRNA synthetase
MTPPIPPVVGRLAPSPTGGLHLGHARTFLAAWLAARGAGGRVVLRVEDLDRTRVRPGAAEAAMTDLRWLGLDWDEGPDVGGPHAPYLQSDRFALYGEALSTLRRGGLAYRCVCSRADIARAASAPHAGDEGPSYPGTCFGKFLDATAWPDGRAFAWRFRVPPGAVAWDDLVMGTTAVDPARVGGDFLLGRSGGEFGYQLAVVVDDAAMGVTQVIRGDDLVPSTPRQVLLYRALGHPVPAFGHLPLAVGPDGRRLAKRDESLKLATLRDRGVDPRGLIGRLAVSLGMAAGAEPSRPREWVGRLDLGRVPRAPWVASGFEDE